MKSYFEIVEDRRGHCSRGREAQAAQPKASDIKAAGMVNGIVKSYVKE